MKRFISGLFILMVLASTPVLADDIVVEKLIQSTASWDGESLPPYAEGQPEITILKFTIPAGAKLANHTHSVINAGVLLSGTLTVVTEDQQEHHLKSGDALIELVGKVHHGQNDGVDPAVIVVFYAGIKGEEFTHMMPGASH